MPSDLLGKLNDFENVVVSALLTAARVLVHLGVAVTALVLALAIVGLGDLVASITSNPHVLSIVTKASDPFVGALAFVVLVFAWLIARAGLAVVDSQA